MQGSPKDYPPPPWRLSGDALLLLCAVDIERARAFVPAPLPILPVAPGKTLGGVFVGRYGGGSTLQYHELIVVPGLVRHGFSVGAWISHIYVDDARSVAGGREIWKLPKQLAQFDWNEQARRVEVRQEAQPLCTLHWTDSQLRGPLPVLAPALSRDGSSLLRFHGTGRAHLSHSRMHVEIPDTSPFGALAIRGRRGVKLDRLALDVHAPRPAGTLEGP